jgi:hypothetical protein
LQAFKHCLQDKKQAGTRSRQEQGAGRDKEKAGAKSRQEQVAGRNKV